VVNLKPHSLNHLLPRCKEKQLSNKPMEENNNLINNLSLSNNTNNKHNNNNNNNSYKYKQIRREQDHHNL
jgi:hypothetical protein